MPKLKSSNATFLVIFKHCEKGHDDIVTLLKHYKRPDEEFAPRGDYGYTPSGTHYFTHYPKHQLFGQKLHPIEYFIL